MKPVPPLRWLDVVRSLVEPLAKGAGFLRRQPAYSLFRVNLDELMGRVEYIGVDLAVAFAKPYAIAGVIDAGFQIAQMAALVASVEGCHRQIRGLSFGQPVGEPRHKVDLGGPDIRSGIE